MSFRTNVSHVAYCFFSSGSVVVRHPALYSAASSCNFFFSASIAAMLSSSFLIEEVVSSRLVTIVRLLGDFESESTYTPNDQHYARKHDLMNDTIPASGMIVALRSQCQ